MNRLVVLVLLAAATARAQAPTQPAATSPAETLFVGVRVFDGTAKSLTAPTSVLVRGNLIAAVGAGPASAHPGARVVDGGGRTLMPGLIDAHTHLAMQGLSQLAVLTADPGYLHVVAAKSAEDMLLRGFTSARDMGGPVFGLKRAIDEGRVPGPRIWPSGAFISQSGGHGDFRLPNEFPGTGALQWAERQGAAAIADSPDAVRLRAREQLALGASQLKLMAGGGVSSSYDPLDVTQYTVPELRAAVEAAENWGTYVTVHAYTPRAVRQAIEAGVKCIEHGQLLDEPTVKLLVQKGLWWSLQPFVGESRYPEGSPNRAKQTRMYEGTDFAYRLARKYRARTAWGSDLLFSPDGGKRAAMLVLMTRWYAPAEVLRMATADNAQLLALSGERSPYPGKLGVVEAGALADLLVVDGDPLTDLSVLEDGLRTVRVVMKDGRVLKDTLSRPTP